MVATPRRLHSVSINNFKGAREIAFLVKAGITQLVGPNGAGKSSALDGIEAALAGARHVPLQPLTEGELRGSVKLDLGDIEVERRFTEKNAERGGSLVVRAKDGSKWGQSELDVLFGDFSFDPLAVSRMKQPELVTLLHNIAGEEFKDELARIDQELVQKRAERTAASQELKSFGTQPDPGTEPELIAIDAVMAELELAQKHNEEQARRASAIQRTGDALSFANGNTGRLETRVAELRQALAKAEAELDASRAAVVAAEGQYRCLPQPEAPQDTKALQAKVAEAGDRNRARDQWQKAHQRWDRWVEASRKVNGLDTLVKKLTDDRIKHARTARLPIPGLSLTTDGVAFNGLPIEQMSSSERLRVCVRIAMALHPNLRVMLIREGSLLDQEAFAEIAELAEDSGYDVLMECVGRPHEGGLMLEIRAGRSGELKQFVPPVAEDGRIAGGFFEPIDAPPNSLTED